MRKFDWTRRRIVAGSIVLVVVVTTTAGALVGRERWNDRCAAGVTETPPEQLAGIRSVTPDQVDLQAFTGPFRTRAQAALDGIRKPGAPLGTAQQVLVAAKDGEPDDDIKLAGSIADGMLVIVQPGERSGGKVGGGLVAIDARTGEARWGRRFSWATRQTEIVPGKVVQLQTPGRQAQIAAVSQDDGKLLWCTKLPGGLTDRSVDLLSLNSAVGGESVYSTRITSTSSDDDGALSLSRVDASTGKLIWNQRLSELSDARSLDAFGPQVLLSRFSKTLFLPEFWRLNGSAEGRPDRDVGALVARSAATGEPTWAYRGPDTSAWVNTVVGVDGDIAVVVSRRPTRAEHAADAGQSWLVGLDQSGKERWRVNTGFQFPANLTDDIRVVGDVILTDEIDRVGNPVRVVARESATGAIRWAIPTTGRSARPKLAVSAHLGNTLLAADMPSFQPGVAIDLATGAISAPFGGASIDAITSDDKTVTVSAGGLLTTFARP